MKLLLINNDYSWLNPIKKELESSFGVTCIISMDGEDGFLKAAASKPEVIVVSLNIGKISGLEVIQMLRDTRSLQASLIIAFSDSFDHAYYQEARLAGADDFFVRSLTVVHWWDRIEHLIKLKEVTINAAIRHERERFASELHDGVQHYLISVKYGLELIGSQSECEKFKEQFEKLVELTQRGIQETKDIAGNLPPIGFDGRDITEVLRNLKADWELFPEMEFRLEGEESLIQLSLPKKIVVHRFVQEGITNALKHAQCSKITIRITESPTDITILLSDNGNGFDKGKTPYGGGFSGFFRKIKKLNGTFELQTQPGKGTTLIMNIPL